MKNDIKLAVLHLPDCTESTYTMEGRRYIVTSVFKETDSASFGDILMKLIAAEVASRP